MECGVDGGNHGACDFLDGRRVFEAEKVNRPFITL